MLASAMRLSRWLLAGFFIVAGAMHFARPGLYLKIMPPYIPFPLAMVTLSGVFEMFLGALTLFPRTRILAGWGLIALLVAVFPANLHVALNPGLFPDVQPWMLWARLPFQAVFMFWVGHATLSKTKNS